MKRNYELSDLQELEARCEVIAQEYGLPLPEVLFHLVQSEEIYDISARGLPGRYSHHHFGRIYQEAKGDYDAGKGRIYEIIINTRPVYAYLLEGNSIIAQLLVIAHCYGHAAIFENNAYFKPADKNILSRVRSGAERVDRYMGEYGREKVEDFIDACVALEMQRDFAILGDKPTAKPPVWEDKPHDILFPEDTARRKLEYKLDKEAFRTRFPKQPERDILAFIEAHTTYLEDWQRDIISIIRTEAEYFIPQMHTQIVNEGAAVFYHQNIVARLMAEDDEFDTDDFMEFQALNARVLHPHIAMQPDPETGEPKVACTGINPYLTSTVILNDIKRICENPTDEERERWPYWAGQIDYQEKRNEIFRIYDDAALLSEFISPRVCEEAKLFMRPRTREEYDDLRISDEEAEEVRKVCVESKTTFGVPVIEIVDADYERQSTLLCIHRDTGKGLDEEYTLGTIQHMANLWGRKVIVESLPPNDGEPVPEDQREKKIRYTCLPNKSPEIEK